MTTTPHLTEDDRQALADGSLAAERHGDAQSHIAACAECAADVRRLEATMKIMRSAPRPSTDVDALWPGIRSRIEGAKVVPLASPPPTAQKRRTVRIAIPLLAAAAVVALVAVPVARRITVQRAAPDNAPSQLIPVSDSIESYEAEAKALLNHLEIQRSLMRPEAAAAIDRDLKTIDSAIEELRIAIAKDPRNPALRQLLASSYRQKVDLLKRAGNAG
jgi:hypothetical protein